jgi:hypothetical protein
MIPAPAIATVPTIQITTKIHFCWLQLACQLSINVKVKVVTALAEMQVAIQRDKASSGPSAALKDKGAVGTAFRSLVVDAKDPKVDVRSAQGALRLLQVDVTISDVEKYLRKVPGVANSTKVLLRLPFPLALLSFYTSRTSPPSRSSIR